MRLALPLHPHAAPSGTAPSEVGAYVERAHLAQE
jgi:hypothetical protein